jgi:hypothetical protein
MIAITPRRRRIGRVLAGKEGTPMRVVAGTTLACLAPALRGRTRARCLLLRRRIGPSLVGRLRVEQLLASPSAAFSQLSAVDVDRRTRRELRQVVDGRVSVWTS